MTDNINNLVADIVAYMYQGQPFKVTPALKALPEEDLLKLATEGLSYLVNMQMRQPSEPETA